jgi:hypothetical protein
MKKQRSFAKVTGIVAIGFFATTAAQAQITPSTGVPASIDLKYTGATFGGYNRFIRDNSSGSEYSAGSLLFNTKAPATSAPLGSFATYCVELNEHVRASMPWVTYTLTAFTPNVASSLAHLYQVAGGSPGTKNDSSAFQAAVWEITHETISGPYSLNDGSFKGSFQTGSITTQANTWLTAVNNFSGPDLFKAQKYVSAGYQDQLVITAVPEPESYAMLLAGLGLMGTIARRRNKQKTS